MCIFCKIVNKDIPSAIVFEDEDIIAFNDVNPSTKGHTLVIPKKHYATIYDIDECLLKKLILVVKKLSIQLTNENDALGVNIVNNNGEVAGQTVHHLHFHIIPRYSKEDSIQV